MTNNIQLPSVKVLWAVLIPVLAQVLEAIADAINAGEIPVLSHPWSTLVLALIALAMAYIRPETRAPQSARDAVIVELADRRLLTAAEAAKAREAA